MTHATLLATGRQPSPTPWDLLLNRGTAASLRGGLLRTALHVEQRYVFVEDRAAAIRDRWRVEVVAYRYTLSEQDTHRELFAFHWHPGEERIAIPHLHPGSRILRVPTLANIHVPTGIQMITDVIWFAIHELRIQPERADWQLTLTEVGAALAAG